MAIPKTGVQPKRPTVKIPPLENGDRLTRAEFERRYNAMPSLKKAELIEGIVYLTSGVPFESHAEPHADVAVLGGLYRLRTPGVRAANNATVRLDLTNELQPDVVVIIDPRCGGQARISEDGYLELAPEWAGEVASSSVSIDLHGKFQVYRRNQVREYVVWRVLDKEIDWFLLRGDRYERLALTDAGIYKSEVFPGLWLDPVAMVNGDLARVHQLLHEGLASPEHAAFVERLKQAKAR